MSSSLLDIRASEPPVQTETRDWKKSLTDYERLTALHFSSKEDFRTASRAIFAFPALRKAPFRSGGLNCLIVPEEAAVLAVPVIAQADIRCRPQPVIRVADLPVREAATIRKRAGFIYG